MKRIDDIISESAASTKLLEILHTNYGQSKGDSNVMNVLIRNVAFSNTNKASDTINEETPFLFFGDNGDHS